MDNHLKNLQNQMQLERLKLNEIVNIDEDPEDLFELLMLLGEGSYG